ncbi:MAG TPA: DUF3329 domain-containing protein [Devosiaceae bacterium]
MAFAGLDSAHPFFRPLWRRIATLAVCVGWAGFEVIWGEPTWALVAVGLFAYGFWTLIVKFAPEEKPAPPGKKE